MKTAPPFNYDKYYNELYIRDYRNGLSYWSSKKKQIISFFYFQYFQKFDLCDILIFKK